MKNLITILAITGLATYTQAMCWKKAYGRGIGSPITTCAAGLEQNGLLCYPYCKEGYKGVGPVCW